MSFKIGFHFTIKTLRLEIVRIIILFNRILSKLSFHCLKSLSRQMLTWQYWLRRNNLTLFHQPSPHHNSLYGKYLCSDHVVKWVWVEVSIWQVSQCLPELITDMCRVCQKHETSATIIFWFDLDLSLMII